MMREPVGEDAPLETGELGGGGVGGMGSDGGAGGTTQAVGGGGSQGSVVAFTRYRHDEVRSPINEHVANTVREIVAAGDGDERVFMKVGASGTISSKFLDCLAGTEIDLDGRVALQTTIDHFDAGDADGSSPWERNTLAAVSGRTASWAISGDPSPIESEIAAIDPRFALVNYGTNDMMMGATHRSALAPFYTSFTALLDQLDDEGIATIITGLNPRTDSVTAARWIPTYNAVVRGVAEARQLPYINLYEAVVGLPDHGLVGDGLHGNMAPWGGCDFTADGLAFNYNVRNLLTLEALHDVRLVAAGGEAPSDVVDAYAGSGTASDPIVIDRLPFTHATTTDAGTETIDAYPACDAGQDESGGEIYYRLDLTNETPLRFIVLDREGVDVDLHLLADAPDPDQCLDRDNRIIEDTLSPGTYYLVVDTYVSSSGALSGDYLFTAIACEDNDPDC